MSIFIIFKKSLFTKDIVKAVKNEKEAIDFCKKSYIYCYEKCRLG